MEEYNPRLRAAILEVVEEQLKKGDPSETRETLDRLIREGFSKDDARVLLGQVVAVELYCISKEKKPFNRERFVRNLRALPAEPHE
jgi:formate dehydrogenase maturation protein FdhE